MRKILILGTGLFLAACGGNPGVPPTVSWGYGAGNGDPVAYNGTAPKYSFANGLGQDMPVQAGQMPKISYGYGEEQATGDTVRMNPAPPQQLAAPAPTVTHPAIAPAANSHS